MDKIYALIADYGYGKLSREELKIKCEQIIKEIKAEALQEAVDNGEYIAVEDTDTMLEVLRP